MSKLFSYVGDIVLDPFIGGDDILIVIVQINRRTISVEIDKNCYQIVKNRPFKSKVEQLFLKYSFKLNIFFFYLVSNRTKFI